MTDIGFVCKNGLSVNGGIFVVNTSQNAVIISNELFIGNSSVNTFINSTSSSLVANSTSFVGTVSAANVVSNAQLQANLANYQTTAGLAANVISDSALQLQVISPNFGGTTVWSITNATTTMASVTLTANTTFGVPSGMSNGTYLMFVKQANGGSNIITWYANNWLWPSGVAPILSTANGAIDILSFIYNSSITNSGNVAMFGTYAPNFQG